MAKIIIKDTAVNERLGMAVIELPLGNQIDVFTPSEPGFVGIGYDDGVMGDVILVGLPEKNDPESDEYDPEDGEYFGHIYTFEQTRDGFEDLSCEATIGHDRSNQANLALYNIAVDLFCMPEDGACFEGSITVVDDNDAYDL